MEENHNPFKKNSKDKGKNLGFDIIRPGQSNFNIPVAPAADTPDWVHRLSSANPSEKAESKNQEILENTFKKLQESLLNNNSKKYEPSSSKQE
jgi:hypothetical protein